MLPASQAGALDGKSQEREELIGNSRYGWYWSKELKSWNKKSEELHSKGVPVRLEEEDADGSDGRRCGGRCGSHSCRVRRPLGRGRERLGEGGSVRRGEPKAVRC